ncbi:MAG: aromatic amino acid lyase [Pseudomonadota bacterium]
MTVLLTKLSDLDLRQAWAVGFEGQAIELSEQARHAISTCRAAYERLLSSDNPPYMYGSTTAPGARAKKPLSADDQARLVQLQNMWASREIGMGQKCVPAHGMRLVLMARVASYIEGHTAVSLPTAEWVAGLSRKPMGKLPLEAATGPGEVMALSWLYPNQWDIALNTGEIMALYNGSPCATGLALDAALTGRRRLGLFHRLMGLVIEAVAAPLEAYDPAIAVVSADPHMKSAIDLIGQHLKGTPREGRLPHQAPVSWRILPTVLAAQMQAVEHAETVAVNALQSVAQNPLFVPPDADHPDGRMLSTGGYHNHQASRMIDGLNAAGADICVLAGKQTARLMDGAAFNLPRLLVNEGSGVVSTEFLAWAQTGVGDRARLSAAPATLPTGLEDPGGAQSDVASPIFQAYERHLDISDDVAASLAVLSVAMVQTYRLTERRPPPALKNVYDEIAQLVVLFTPEQFVALGQSMRDVKALFLDAVIGKGPLARHIDAKAA